MDEEIELNTTFAHESLDRMYLIMDMFDEYVVKHPFVSQTPELLEQAQDLAEKMYLMYNNIGRVYSRYEDIS